MATFGQNLKKIRLFLDLGQTEFAQTIGISQGALSKIENGTKNVDFDILERIVTVYDVDLDWLVMDKGTPPNKDYIKAKYAGLSGTYKEAPINKNQITPELEQLIEKLITQKFASFLQNNKVVA